MYERFKYLCELKGISVSQACKEIGIQPSAATNWKTRGGTATVETCQKIADYFNVSVDYIMNGTIPSLNKPDISVTIESEQINRKAIELYELYANADPTIRGMVDYLLTLKDPQQPS